MPGRADERAAPARSRPAVLAALLILALAAVYLPVLRYPFLTTDDNIHTFSNPYLAGPPSKLLHFWREPHEKLYIPVTYTLWYLQAKIAASPSSAKPGAPINYNPAVFHAANLAVHGANCILVMSLLLGLGAGGPGALAGALLFGLHPLQAESVVWISEFKGLLAAFFVLAALRLHLAAVATATETETAKEPPAAGGNNSPRTPLIGAAGAGLSSVDMSPNRGVLIEGSKWDHPSWPPEASSPLPWPPQARAPWLRLAAWGCLLLAMLSKPSAGAAPFLLLAMDLAVLRRPWKEALAEAVPWVLAVPPFLMMAKMGQPDTSVGQVAAFWQRPLVYGDALAFYLGKLLVPVNLCIDYGRTPARVLGAFGFPGLPADKAEPGAWVAYVTWLAPAGLAALIWLRKSLRWLAGPYALFCLAFLPVSGLVPFIYQKTSTVADRYCYLPLFGAALALALGWTRAGRLMTRMALYLVVAAAAAIGMHQIWLWRDSLSVYEHTLAINPRSTMVKNNYGAYLIDSNRLVEALDQMRQALELNPGAQEFHSNMAVLMQRMGRSRDIPGYLRDVLNESGPKPTDPTVRNTLRSAQALTHRGKLVDAETQYAEAVQRFPDQAILHRFRAANLALLGHLDQAADEYRVAVRLQPDYLQAQLGLAGTLALWGKLDEARNAYDDAVRLRPDLVEPRMSLGNVLLILGRSDEAADQYREVLRVKPAFKDAAARLAAIEEKAGEEGNDNGKSNGASGGREE